MQPRGTFPIGKPSIDNGTLTAKDTGVTNHRGRIERGLQRGWEASLLICVNKSSL